MGKLESKRGFRFVYVWKWICDEAIVHVEGADECLDDILFESRESAVDFISDHLKDISLYYEDYCYGELEPRESQPRYFYDEQRDLHELRDDHGYTIVLGLRGSSVAFWHA